MSSGVRFVFVMEAPSQDALDERMIEILQSRGYVLTVARNWEKPCQFCLRLGISGQHLHRQTRHPLRPHVDIMWGPSKRRVLFISSNPEFDDFVRRNKSPVK